MRAQYLKQSSLSPVWRLYLPVSYVTMPKLHGAECIRDEGHCVIACAILMVGSCRFESLFTCYIINLAAFGVLYRNVC